MFGRVIEGEQFVVEIENQKVDTNHRPYADVRISNSGELVLVKGTCVGGMEHSSSISIQPLLAEWQGVVVVSSEKEFSKTGLMTYLCNIYGLKSVSRRPAFPTQHASLACACEG